MECFTFGWNKQILITELTMSRKNAERLMMNTKMFAYLTFMQKGKQERTQK